MEDKKKEPILIPVGNSTLVKLKADFYKCKECGKELIGKKESLRIAKIVDKISDRIR